MKGYTSSTGNSTSWGDCARAHKNLGIGIVIIILTLDEGPVGTEVRLTGMGFEPGFFNLFIGSRNIALGDIDHNGEVDLTFIVPDVGPGRHDVTVIDSFGVEGSASFTVTPSFVVPELPLGTITALVTMASAVLLRRKK